MPFISRRLRAALLATASATLVAATLPSPEPLGIGDRLFPYLGNPGYDVLSYDISFTYDGRNTEPLDAVTTIEARTTEPLERVNLDFARGKVSAVEVNGLTSDFATTREDLVVQAPTAIPAGVPLRITVRHTSDPNGSRAEGGWLRTSDGLAMANQADAAHRVFPGNDHPADKAYFTFRITAPEKLTAVANGLPVSTQRRGATTTWTYRTEHPMATELAQVSIGTSAIVHRTGPHGLPLRDVVPAADRARLEPWLKKTPDQMAWMERQVGRYPFETYGLLVADTSTGFELETQTLSLFERPLFTEPGYPEWYVDSVMVHELAHQWFGNSVSPQSWSDLWLNEGHASWYEARYAEEHADQPLERRMRQAYTRSDAWRAAGGPRHIRTPRSRATRSVCSGRWCTTAVRSSSTPCGRRSARRRSTGWNGPGCGATRTSPRRRRTSPASPPTSRAATWVRSSRRGCMARRHRRCPGTRTGAARSPRPDEPGAGGAGSGGRRR
ncbi:hypothetical protein Sfulv_46020 [Streptomyces fulvorobeus]|uniref:Aminopeptidase N n=1 Tax=Streptomyces fulvorobeus TaxID=284028 RepID=A0A7J0CBA7_9ACTN|nr:hypothetical protein Sfulv_46020 [Streptomyces fulvorobeus]